MQLILTDHSTGKLSCFERSIPFSTGGLDRNVQVTNAGTTWKGLRLELKQKKDPKHIASAPKNLNPMIFIRFWGCSNQPYRTMWVFFGGWLQILNL